MTDTHIPKWRETWQVNNPEWVTARKKEWLEIKKSPVLKHTFKKYELTQIKQFFMTGSAYPDDLDPDDLAWRVYHPDTRPLPVRYNVLLQCWLAPTIDLERWSAIKKHSSLGGVSNLFAIDIPRQRNLI